MISIGGNTIQLSQQSLGFQRIMMKEAKTIRWHIVWVTLSAMIAISIPAPGAHS